MNPGYVSIWIIIIVFILITTGWKSYLAPDISRRTMAFLGIITVLLLNVSLWWSPFPPQIQVQLHVSACLFILAGLMTYIDSEDWSYKGYLLLCAVMIAVIWGFIRKMYSYDPIFHWVDPRWDAPLLCGMFCGAFTSQVKQQFGMVVWGAVLGEMLNAVLQAGVYTAYIGSLSWWDSFWIAMAAARSFSLLLKTIRLGASKLSGMLWHIKGGRSS